MGGQPIVFYFVIEGTQKEIIKKKGARRPDDLAKKKWLAFLERGIKGVVKEGYSKNPKVNFFILDRHTCQIFYILSKFISPFLTKPKAELFLRGKTCFSSKKRFSFGFLSPRRIHERKLHDPIASDEPLYRPVPRVWPHVPVELLWSSWNQK